MNEEYDFIIVGAGISGCTLAERIANILNKKVLVIEKRDHIGGNCYDYYDDAGILIPKYGPHFFHTNDESVWEYVNLFSEWIPYEHRVLSFVDGKLVPIPVNIDTVNILFNLNISSEMEMEEWLFKNTEKIINPKNSEEVCLSRFGRPIYEKLFKNYTYKQWNKYPIELSPDVLKRIPIRTNRDDRYFTDKYQAMPKYGYTKMFEKMLSNELITIRLNTDFHKLKLDMFIPIIYTGRIDLFFSDIGYEKLEYRSLIFKNETLPVDYFQSRAQINYPNDYEFTRITEPKHATGQKSKVTTIIKEYSTSEGEPYYPVLSDKNLRLYALYKELSNKYSPNTYFVGRLAEYKYFNMDQAFKNALSVFENIKINFKK